MDLVLDEETGPLNEEQGQYLDIIERNADRLSRLINDILDISRIEAGRIDLALAPPGCGRDRPGDRGHHAAPGPGHWNECILS